MKGVKIIAIVALGYVGLVVAFESLLGYFQPAGETSMVITTTDADGNHRDRVVTRLESDGKLYAAANHWPRAWYRQVLSHPEVEITVNGEKRPYQAFDVSDDEYRRVNASHPLGIGVRILTGFPPRRFVRFEPR